MTLFDFLAVLVILVSGAVGFIRGAAREVLTVLAFVIAVAIGLVRALIMLGVFYLIFNWVTPAERTPAWIKDAALYPVSRTAGHVLMTLAPQGVVVADKVGPALENAVREGSSDAAPAPPAGKGKSYDEGSRKTVDDLVEKTR